MQVGAFRCPVGHPAFEDSGPIQNHVFVFPRTSVWLCHLGQRPFLADPALVTLYNRGQRYRRGAVGPHGDECEWFAVAPELLVGMVAHHDPRVRDQPGRPFRHAYAPCSPRTYLAQRALCAALVEQRPLEALEVEERVLGLLSSVLSAAYGFWGAGTRARDRTGRQGEAVAQARELLSQRLGEPLGIAEIARAVGLSAFHLCRSFRSATGSSLHSFRNQMRLRAALERVADGEDLTRIALDLGYSSHSHFTSAFRTSFGVTPSQARGRLRAPGSASRDRRC